MTRALLAGILATALAALGQSAYKPGRTSYGEPDFRGIWQTKGTANWNVEGHRGGKGVPAAKSVIVDPPDGKIPYLPEALAKRNSMKLADDPQNKCFLDGIPRTMYVPGPFQIFQAEKMVVMLFQHIHSFREIPIGKPQQQGLEMWMGSSKGEWDGDTLVVETVSFNSDTWFDKAGNHHSPDMKVVERFTQTGRNTMRYEVRIEDPKTFTRPWTMRLTMDRRTEPGFRILEDDCIYDEKGNLHHTAPSAPRP